MNEFSLRKERNFYVIQKHFQTVLFLSLVLTGVLLLHL
ncbi:hypothetical protein LEP1GSC088_1196 [Leptospira interrogans str. L1207]|nr:hypothetical protein LEP1GSC088_1196 [Leptospira interrogans str. L1207]